MEMATLIIVSILVPIFTAVLGGWVGAYYGNKYRENKEFHEKAIVRNIAIRALNILKSYSRKSYREAEGEFNKSMCYKKRNTNNNSDMFWWTNIRIRTIFSSCW